MAKAEGMEAVATEGVDAGVDTMEVTAGVMEGVEVITMDISFPEPSVMAMVLMPTEAAAVHAIQGQRAKGVYISNTTR
jgi:hypothetical protein